MKQRHFLLAILTVLLTTNLISVFVIAIEPDAASYKHTRTEIEKRWQECRPDYQAGYPFSVTPSFKPPFAPGQVKPEYLNEGLKMINFARFLAGVPDDVALDPNMNSRAQAVALTMVANYQIGHYPLQPLGMDDGLFAVAKADAPLCAISDIKNNSVWDLKLVNFFPLAVMNCAADEDATNVERVGHRRALLRPEIKKTGLGYVSRRVVEDRKKGEQMWNGEVSEFPDGLIYHKHEVAAIEIQDTSRKVAYDYIAWPAPGYFPNFYLKFRHLWGTYPWTVTPNPQQYRKPELGQVTVELVRVGDGKTWLLNQKDNFIKGSNDNRHEYFNIDPATPRLPSTIIFRPDEGFTCNPGDRYRVSVTGLKDLAGKPAEIKYLVEFIELPLDDLLNSNKIDDPVDPGYEKLIELKVAPDTKRTQAELELEPFFQAFAKEPKSTNPARHIGPIRNGRFEVSSATPSTPDFINITYGMIMLKENRLWAKIELKALPETLQFNISEVKDGNLEYDWTIGFDTDGEPGYEYEIQLKHIKEAGKPLMTGPLEAIVTPVAYKSVKDQLKPLDCKVNFRVIGYQLLFMIDDYTKVFPVKDGTEVLFNTWYDRGRIAATDSTF